jgi:nucleoside-diphosphate-sugar epimerase
MRIAITGATGFLGRYIVQQLTETGNECRCWFRPTSRLDGISVDPARLQWLTGELGDAQAAHALVEGCDAVVHSALHHPGGRFRDAGTGDIHEFLSRNLLGTIQLIEAARRANVPRFVFISTCAVHDVILPDRKLDEAHPLWPVTHYGAHKAAIEKFVHSYGLGQGYPICALRPTGIYGLADPPTRSKWYNLVAAVVGGEEVQVSRDGKEVHAADVARAVSLLLTAPNVAGQAYNCYDQYVSEYDVATIAKSISGSDATIVGEPRSPLNQIDTSKIRALGMEFGGWELLESTIGELVEIAQAGLNPPDAASSASA